MSEELNHDQLLQRAAQLRRAFDRSFAEPPPPLPPPTSDFIAIGVGADTLALRVSEIDALHADTTVVPVPSPVPEFMGLAGFRGKLTPVYDLAALLGYPSSSGRWLALADRRSVAFAFDRYHEHFRIEASAAVAGRSGNRRHIHSIAQQGDRAWPIVDLVSLVAALRQRAAGVSPKQE